MDKDKVSVIREIVINNFSEYIQTTAKIRPKPYIKNKGNLPKKYQNSLYEFRTLIYYGKTIEALVRKSDGFIIPSNSRTVDKPRNTKVNGQDIYNQNSMKFGRAKLVGILHGYFENIIKNIEPITENYPLKLELEFNIHDMGKLNIDNDNKWIWTKCFQDTLVSTGKLPDDNVNYINENITKTNFIDESQSQSLIIRIYG